MSDLQKPEHQPLPTGRLRKILAVSLSLHAIMFIAFAILDSMEVYMVHCEVNEVDVNETVVSLNAVGNNIFMVGNSATAFFSGIVYLTFIYRLNWNARALRGIHPSLSPRLAVVVYFAPIANLVLPYVNLQELWRIGKSAAPDWRKQSGSALVGLYWTMVLGSRFIVLASRLLYTSLDAHVVLLAVYLSLFADFVVLANSYVVWRLISRCDEQINRQISLRREIGQQHCSQCSEQIPVKMESCPMCGARV